MSYFLPRLESGWHVDQAILAEESRVVVIRFGHDWDSDCMRHDETLLRTAEKVKNMAVICEFPLVVVDAPRSHSPRVARSQTRSTLRRFPTSTRCALRHFRSFRVQELTKHAPALQMYELYDPCTTMCVSSSLPPRLSPPCLADFSPPRHRFFYVRPVPSVEHRDPPSTASPPSATAAH